MAVYAAYRHIELDKIGYGKKRVLKPPGGGSSDIFAAEGASQPARRNRNQSQLQSSMFTNMMETTAAKSKSGNTSHSRLFGSEPPSNSHRDHAKPVENDVTDAPSNDQARDNRRNPINHAGMTAADCSQTFNSTRNQADRKPDGNPITGEGYAIANGVKEIAATNGIAQPVAVSETSSTTASSPKSNGVKSAPPSRPGRVPPGGFSSGLW